MYVDGEVERETFRVGTQGQQFDMRWIATLLAVHSVVLSPDREWYR